jgi:hypothetical protein
MYNSVILVSAYDEEKNAIGLLPAHSGGMWAQDGYTVAHDTVEHINGLDRIGEIEDELEAFGAVWYIRGQFGDAPYAGTRPSSDDIFDSHIVADVLISEMVRMGHEWLANKSVYTVRKPMEGAAVHELCRLVDEVGRRSRCTNFRDYLRMAIAALHNGYRKAEVQHPNAIKANQLFWAVAKAADDAILEIRSEGEYYRLRYGYDDYIEPLALCLRTPLW